MAAEVCCTYFIELCAHHCKWKFPLKAKNRGNLLVQKMRRKVGGRGTWVCWGVLKCALCCGR